MKKRGFVLAIIGLLFLVLNYEMSFKLADETTVTLDIIPDFIGYLLLFLSCMTFRKSVKGMSAAAAASFAGILISAVQTALKPNYGISTGFNIIFEILTAVSITAFVFFYMNGLKNLTAPERHDAEHIYSGSGLKEVYGSLSGTAGSYGTMFCIVKIISAIVNIIYFAMLPSQGDVPPLGISMLAIVFGALEYACFVLVIILLIRFIAYKEK